MLLEFVNLMVLFADCAASFALRKVDWSVVYYSFACILHKLSHHRQLIKYVLLFKYSPI